MSPKQLNSPALIELGQSVDTYERDQQHRPTLDLALLADSGDQQGKEGIEEL